MHACTSALALSPSVATLSTHIKIMAPVGAVRAGSARAVVARTRHVAHDLPPQPPPPLASPPSPPVRPTASSSSP
jgi:hypothetical protein